MKTIVTLSILLLSFKLLACDDTISQYGFELSDDLPRLCESTGSPSDRHTPKPIGTTNSGQGYYEYLPQGYENDDQDYPLLVFIHGLGENGNGDSQLNDLLATGIPQLIDNNQWDEQRPFVVLSPQNSQGGCTRSSDIHAFINFAKENYRINQRRVYLTGLSCGAIGSWNYLGSYTNSQIAAIVPIAGDGNSAFNSAGCELNRVPIWAFHGDNDGTVGVGGTTGPINNLLACTNPAPLDTSMVIYPGVGHFSWQMTYDLSAGHDIYSWFLGKVNLEIVDPSPLEVGRSIQVDLGVSSGSTPEPWNNLTSTSGGINLALDDQSTKTTISFSIIDAFNSTNQDGIGTNDLGLPETVTADSFWVGSFDGHKAGLLESATVTVSGLDPQATYDLELFASRSGDDSGRFRLTRYTVNGNSLDLEVSDNTTNTIVFENLTGQETIDLHVNLSPDGTGRFAYLGGLILQRVN